MFHERAFAENCEFSYVRLSNILMKTRTLFGKCQPKFTSVQECNTMIRLNL